jgi:hypothetical protein
VSLFYDLDPREADFQRWILNVVRRTIIPADVEIRRVIRENPEWVREHAPWLFNVFDVRSQLPGLSGEEKVTHHIGLMPPDVESRRTRPVKKKTVSGPPKWPEVR